VTWRSEVLAVIRNRWRVGQEFTINELYLLEDEFSRCHPGNKNVRPKIRQTLQSLRRDMIVEFVNNQGTYRRRF
jgi:type II restriction enzyme